MNFFKDYLFIFREKGRERKREGEKHQCVVASHSFPTEDHACNPGMCPDWESNRWPFGLQAGAQSTELHQPGLFATEFIYHDFKTKSFSNFLKLRKMTYISSEKHNLSNYYMEF